MSFTDKVAGDVIAALKAGEDLKKSTLRLLLNALRLKEKELKSTLADDDAFRIIATMIRQRGESIESYTKGGRPELADKEAAEIEILKAYLPPQLSAEELLGIVKAAAEKISASGMKDMGKLMKEVMPEVKGKADGKAVNETVKRVLAT
jgi:uncharacterized protein YqeY